MTDKRDLEDPIEKYERLAEAFRRETGMMAPGKDEAAAAYSGHSDEERYAAWRQWLKKHMARK